MKTFITGIGLFFGSIIILALAAAINGIFIMWLWNWLLVPIFNLCTITWLQGWGISFLSALLFKNNNTSNSSKRNK